MSLIYIHESVIPNNTQATANPDQNNISMLDTAPMSNSNYTDISFCDLQSANQYLNDQIANFSNTFSVNNYTTIPIVVGGKNCGAKTMQQRYLDLITMQLGFNGILSAMSRSLYGDDYLKLKDTQQANINMRQSLMNEWNELTGNDPNKIFKNAHLDSTIYSTILWTILAIILIYYIFIRVDQ
jgi:hypothetical protein